MKRITQMCSAFLLAVLLAAMLLARSYVPTTLMIERRRKRVCRSWAWPLAGNLTSVIN